MLYNYTVKSHYMWIYNKVLKKVYQRTVNIEENEYSLSDFKNQRSSVYIFKVFLLKFKYIKNCYDF